MAEYRKLQFDPMTKKEFNEQIEIVERPLMIALDAYCKEHNGPPPPSWFFEKGFFYGGMAVLENESVRETFETMIQELKYQL